MCEMFDFDLGLMFQQLAAQKLEHKLNKMQKQKTEKFHNGKFFLSQGFEFFSVTLLECLNIQLSFKFMLHKKYFLPFSLILILGNFSIHSKFPKLKGI